MSDFDNTNRGVLFTNDKKQNANHPDFRGNINVDGVEYWLSAWNKRGQKGGFISLSVQPKDAKPVSAHSAAKADGYVKQPVAETTAEALSDDIPW